MRNRSVMIALAVAAVLVAGCSRSDDAGEVSLELVTCPNGSVDMKIVGVDATDGRDHPIIEQELGILAHGDVDNIGIGTPIRIIFAPHELELPEHSTAESSDEFTGVVADIKDGEDGGKVLIVVFVMPVIAFAELSSGVSQMQAGMEFGGGTAFTALSPFVSADEEVIPLSMDGNYHVQLPTKKSQLFVTQLGNKYAFVGDSDQIKGEPIGEFELMDDGKVYIPKDVLPGIYDISGFLGSPQLIAVLEGVGEKEDIVIWDKLPF